MSDYVCRKCDAPAYFDFQTLKWECSGSSCGISAGLGDVSYLFHSPVNLRAQTFLF